MKRRIPLLVLAVTSLALAVFLVASRLEIRRLGARDARYRVLCGLVRVSVAQDAKDLRDPNQQKAALARFLEPVAHHSYEDVNQCVDEPVSLDRTKCEGDADYAKCVAAMAESAAEAIRRNLD